MERAGRRSIAPDGGPVTVGGVREPGPDAPEPAFDPEDPVPSGAESTGDSRRALSYLLAGEAEDYIAVMDVLEASVTDLSPADVARALREADRPLAAELVEARLDSLRDWGAAHATTDTSRVRRHSDLLSRNWRYTATAVGRQVHRFYRGVLAGTPAVREIPLAGLNRVVKALESLAERTAENVPEAIGIVFVNHDDIDAALVGAEDALTGLVDRYDLDGESTAELRQLLVDYATRVAGELANGSALAAGLLARLSPRFTTLAAEAVAASDARVLIERGTLRAARGGRLEDWEGLLAWFDPSRGRAALFAMRLVRALPGMHANLRRLHTSTGAATSRARALQLASACSDPEFAQAITCAALGDHSWRKLWRAADDEDLVRTPSWESGPQVEVPDMLVLTGRGGARGRPAAARDDAEAKEAVAAAREARAAAHAVAVTEVLCARPGLVLSDNAARVAMQSLMATVRGPAVRGVRRAVCDGLACTLIRVATIGDCPAVAAGRFKVWTPGRVAFFHRPGESVGAVVDNDERVEVCVIGALEGAAGGRAEVVA